MTAGLRAKLASIVLTSLLAATPGSAEVAVPAASAVVGPYGTDLFLTPAEAHEFAIKLGSAKPGTWREGQQRLAWGGVSGLSAVNSFVKRSGRRHATRVRGYLDLALRASVTPRELSRYPRLEGLVAADIAEWKRLAAGVVAARQKLDEGSALRPDVMRPLDGFAVPAALLLLEHDQPQARARGVAILRELNAVSGIPSLERMRADQGRFGVWHDDYGTTEVVGDAAAETSARLQDAVKGRFRYELYLPDPAQSSVLVNGLRQYAGTLDRSRWDDWWDAARPAWNAWWDLADVSSDEATVKTWWRLLQEAEGWSYTWNEDGPTSLRILGPSTFHCEVLLANRPIYSGALPVQLTRELDRALEAERTREGSSGYGSLDVKVTRPGLPAWERKGFVAQPGRDLTITILERARPLP